jgi:hypothetical protein
MSRDLGLSDSCPCYERRRRGSTWHRNSTRYRGHRIEPSNPVGYTGTRIACLSSLSKKLLNLTTEHHCWPEHRCPIHHGTLSYCIRQYMTSVDSSVPVCEKQSSCSSPMALEQNRGKKLFTESPPQSMAERQLRIRV